MSLTEKSYSRATKGAKFGLETEEQGWGQDEEKKGHRIWCSMHSEQLFWDYPNSNARLTLMLFSSRPIV